MPDFAVVGFAHLLGSLSDSRDDNVFLPFCRTESAIGSGMVHDGTGKQSWLFSPCQPGMETNMLNRNCVSKNALLHSAQPSATATVLLLWSLCHKFSGKLWVVKGNPGMTGTCCISECDPRLADAGAVWDEWWDQPWISKHSSKVVPVGQQYSKKGSSHTVLPHLALTILHLSFQTLGGD